MMKFVAFTASLAVFTGISVSQHIASARATTSTDCTNAESMIEQAYSARPVRPQMTGQIDKDFATLEVRLAKAEVAMARVETVCGKTAATKSSAASLERQSEARLQMFRDQGQS